MSKMIQIRDVPDDVHRTLKERATRAGMTLSDYLKRELRRAAETLTLEEWYAQVRSRRPVRSELDSVQIIRELRDTR